MFWMDKSKLRAPDVIVSPDTRRAKRIPPGQSRTRKWLVLDASGPPSIDISRWRLRIGGLVGRPAVWGRTPVLRPASTPAYAQSGSWKLRAGVDACPTKASEGMGRTATVIS